MSTKQKPNHTILIMGVALFVISRITSFIYNNDFFVVSTMVLTFVGIGMVIYDLLPRALIGNPTETAETVPITNQASTRIRLGIMLLLVAVPIQLFLSFAAMWSDVGLIIFAPGLLFAPGLWFLIKGYTARFTAVEHFHVLALILGLLLLWFELTIADLYRTLADMNQEPIYLQRSFILGLSALIIFSTLIHIKYGGPRENIPARLPDEPPPPPNNVLNP